MTDEGKPLLIKRYASRRLYNTETSDYVTLEDIAGFIRAGREVRIVDLKSGDDLTRSYLLQIIAEHESKGESVLPLGVLTDLVRSYTGTARSVVPEFLASSFEMLRSGQSKMIENMTALNPMAQMPGVKAMQESQAAFFKAMTGTWPGPTEGPAPTPEAEAEPPEEGRSREELDEIRRQLAEMQAMLAKMNK
ncbi:MAG: polyhydroxyalkanoate synthesis repressor PhaR [Jannaschia sp.]